MAIRSIHMLGSPVLREQAIAVDEIDGQIRRLVEDLFDTMRADKGIGLAANQLGERQRVAVVDVGDDDPVILINPTLIEREGTVRGEEGCLSIPDLFADVDRSARIVVETTGLDGTRHRIEANELKSRAIQHEIDHLDGILFLDHLGPLKRRMLLKKWLKQRKGQTGYLKEVTAAGTRS